MTTDPSPRQLWRLIQSIIISASCILVGCDASLQFQDPHVPPADLPVPGGEANVVDADGNGLRDDLDAYLRNAFAGSSFGGDWEMLARALQDATATSEETSASVVSSIQGRISDAVACLSAAPGSSNPQLGIISLQSIVVDTPARSHAWALFEAHPTQPAMNESTCAATR